MIENFTSRLKEKTTLLSLVYLSEQEIHFDIARENCAIPVIKKRKI